jgi:hypothetical protein
MSGDTPDRDGYDEAKVFEVADADPEAALQVIQRSVDDPKRLVDPLEETREVLMRYGVRGLPSARSFSAPFLWYNILPGRSVPIRKLPVHLIQMRASSEPQALTTPDAVEDQVRRLAGNVKGVVSLGECFVARIRTGFLVGLNVTLPSELSVGAAFEIAQETEDIIRKSNARIRHVFVQIVPHMALN